MKPFFARTCVSCIVLTSTLLAVNGFFLVSSTSRRKVAVKAFATESIPRTSHLSASNANELNPLKPGSTVALTTPFDSTTGKIDFAGLRKLLQFHVEQGTDNLCILGTTGEAAVMSMQEREDVLKVTVEEVKGKMPIMVGTGTINPDAVKAMTLQAMDIGCDASLLVTPYYVKPPQRCLIQHFTSAANFGLPVVMYNVPGRTAVDMSDGSLATAAMHENIVAVKDATGDVTRVQSLRKELASAGVEKKFLLYSGDDGTSADFVLAGGDGCISVSANVAPNAMHRMMQAARQGDSATTKEINDPLALLHQNLFCEASPLPVKWAMERLHLTDSAWCRPPLDVLDTACEPLVEDALRQAALLK